MNSRSGLLKRREKSRNRAKRKEGVPKAQRTPEQRQSKRKKRLKKKRQIEKLDLQLKKENLLGSNWLRTLARRLSIKPS